MDSAGYKCLCCINKEVFGKINKYSSDKYNDSCDTVRFYRKQNNDFVENLAFKR